MIGICPRCLQRYMTSKYNNDVIHECNSGDNALDTEDLTVIGSWEDYTGSGTENKFEVTHRGTDNELQGTFAGVLGASFGGVTDKGKRLSTHRSRKHLEFINLRGNDGK